MALPQGELFDLMAHCVSLSVDAVLPPNGFGMEGVETHVAAFRQQAKLDMRATEQPTAERYFGRVSKNRLLKDMREATSPEDAETCEGMKKQAGEWSSPQSSARAGCPRTVRFNQLPGWAEAEATPSAL